METTTKEQKYRLKDTWSLLKATYKEWSDDDAFGNAASVAYYAVFSLPGLLLIIVSIIGLFMDRTDTVAEITSGLTSMIGAQSAESIAEILVNANIADQSVFMSIVGVGTMLFGATGLFVQLQKSLNSIWEVKKRKCRFHNLIERQGNFSWNNHCNRFPLASFIGAEYSNCLTGKLAYAKFQ